MTQICHDLLANVLQNWRLQDVMLQELTGVIHTYIHTDTRYRAVAGGESVDSMAAPHRGMMMPDDVVSTGLHRRMLLRLANKQGICCIPGFSVCWRRGRLDIGLE